MNALILYFLVGATHVVGPHGLEPQSRIEYLTIVGYSPKPALSGWIRSYIKVTARDARDNRLELLVPYVSRTQKEPRVGSVCSIVYHLESGNGSVGKETLKIKAGKVVDHFSCEKN